MARSIKYRLLHPRIAIEQGLPTARIRFGVHQGRATREVTDETRIEMEDYLKAVPLHHATPKTLAQQDHLYSCLTIIDGKAQALLSFNSFLLAVVGIYVGTIQIIRDQLFLLAPFILTSLASGVSCLFCLDVVWVHWLTKQDMLPAPGETDANVGQGFVELLLLRDERTRTYRVAWFLSFFSVVAVMVGVICAIFTDVATSVW